MWNCCSHAAIHNAGASRGVTKEWVYGKAEPPTPSPPTSDHDARVQVRLRVFEQLNSHYLKQHGLTNVVYGPNEQPLLQPPVTFKPSVKKTVCCASQAVAGLCSYAKVLSASCRQDNELRFIPTNLHLYTADVDSVDGGTPGNAASSAAQQSYGIVTVGAPAAHVYGTSHKGIDGLTSQVECIDNGSLGEECVQTLSTWFPSSP